jgi:large subunit ribosomal protein L4
MHLALVRQLSNRRTPVAHVKHRGEIIGSTKKVYQQKGTGRARRGPIRSPLMRGGGKAFGPRSEANFEKNMPREMRRAALLSCLSWKAKNGGIVGLESYPDDVKTKKLAAVLGKMPVDAGRKVLIVLPAHHRGLELSARNMPKVKTLLAPYLNPEDVLGSKLVVFLVDAIKVAEQTFGARKDRKVAEQAEAAPAADKPKKAAKPKAAKKPAAAKKAAPAKKKASSDSK